MKITVSPAATGSVEDAACQRCAPEAMSSARIVSRSATSTTPAAAVSERGWACTVQRWMPDSFSRPSTLSPAVTAIIPRSSASGPNAAP